MNAENSQKSFPILPMYLISILLHFGITLSAAFIPLLANDLGASLVFIGIITTAKSFGSLASNFPIGFMTGKFCSRNMLIIGILGLILASIAYAYADTPQILLFIGVIFGISMSFWSVTRLDYVRQNIPAMKRGRVMANFGGILRLARMTGPVLGALIIDRFGYSYLFLFQAAVIGAALIILFFFLPAGINEPKKELRSEPIQNVLKYIKNHRRTILASMIGVLGLTIIRSGKNLFIPLWADSIGLSVIQIGLITSITAALELVMVIPAGILMDRKGRSWSVIPTIVVVSIGIACIPLALTFQALLIVSLLLAVGNGLGSGINMVLSTDLAPAKGSGIFIGMWRSLTDGAMIVGPILLGLSAQVFSLAAAPIGLSVIGLLSLIPYLRQFRNKK